MWACLSNFAKKCHLPIPKKKSQKPTSSTRAKVDPRFFGVTSISKDPNPTINSSFNDLLLIERIVGYNKAIFIVGFCGHEIFLPFLLGILLESSILGFKLQLIKTHQRLSPPRWSLPRLSPPRLSLVPFERFQPPRAPWPEGKRMKGDALHTVDGWNPAPVYR